MIGSKVTAILMNGWILPICGVVLGRVCISSLRSRLVLFLLTLIHVDIGWILIIMRGGNFQRAPCLNGDVFETYLSVSVRQNEIHIG